MQALKAFLVLATIAIFAVTIVVVVNHGANWPVVYFGDLVAIDWRSQFNTDLLVHLILLATWICWREGFAAKGYLFGFLSIAFGGMFGFPYLLMAIFRAQGDPAGVLLGVHAKQLGRGSGSPAP